MDDLVGHLATEEGDPVAAALLTPADPVSQLLLAIPLTLLYMVSYGVSSVIARGRKRGREKREAQRRAEEAAEAAGA